MTQNLLTIHQPHSAEPVPPLLNLLAGINPENFAYRHYRLRHPAGTLSICLNDAVNELQRLINNLKQSDATTPELVRDFRMALLMLFRLVDASYEILLGFAPKYNSFGSDFLWKWLSKNKIPEPASMFTTTHHATDDLRNLYNSLKHTSNQLQFVRLTGANNQINLAYSLEIPDGPTGVRADGAIYPISFFREIRRIYFALHLVCHAVYKPAVLMAKKYYGTDLTEAPHASQLSGAFLNLHNDVQHSLLFFLPREVGLTYIEPNLIGTNSGGCSLEFIALTIEPGTLRPFYANGGKVNQETRADGFTLKFSMPGIGDINKVRK